MASAQTPVSTMTAGRRWFGRVLRNEPEQPVREAAPERAMARYVSLFWRVFIPNATVLTVAGAVLVAEPANGQVAILGGGLVTLIAINVLTMRRSFAPLGRLAAFMREIDPLRPGRRIPVLGPPSEVTLVAAAFNDMLDRLEHERRESARRELSAQHAERRHIARELHDELGQTLTALALQLDRIGAGAVPTEQVPEAATAARDTALESVESIRALARRLRPEILDELGLRPAVANLCSRLSERTGLRIETTFVGTPPRLAPDEELVVYRVVQESLTNVVRHAAASVAHVTLRPRPDDLLVRVEDDGVGIAPAAIASGGGIRQMRERVLLIEGELQIGPRPGGGTVVQLQLRLRR